MASRLIFFTALILAVAFVQSLYAVPLESNEGNNQKSLVLNEPDFKPDTEVLINDVAPIRRARDMGVIFRPLFASRERDAEREENRRRIDQAQREREQRKAAKKESARRKQAAATATQYQQGQTYYG